MNKLVSCKQCGWVHFGVSLDYAVDQINKFNSYFKTLSKKDQKESYGGKPSSLLQYILCFRCGSLYTNMRKAKKSEIPFGSTIQPILLEGLNNGK